MKRIWAFIIVAALMCAAGCARSGPDAAEYITYEHFDTVTTVKVAGADEKELKKLADGVLSRLDAVFDIYNDHPGINGAYAVNNSGGDWMRPEPELTELINLCGMWRDISPATDITMGALYEKWHDFREGGALPGIDELEAAAGMGGWDMIEIDGDRMRLISPGARLDFGAVAKGYAAGKLAKALEEAGYTDYIISAGGNVACGARKGGYRVGVQEPDGAGYALILNISGLCAVTSGDYQRRRLENGINYHHIIDTSTLYPADTGTRQVTVICDDSAFADYMSTALFLTDAAAGICLAEKAGVEAVWILENGEVQMTPGAAEYIEKH